MAKRNDDSPRKPAGNKDKELKALYQKYRQEFSAADLQKYTEIAEGIPADKVLAELEEMYRRHTRKKRA